MALQPGLEEFTAPETATIQSEWFDPENAIHSTVQKITQIVTKEEAASIVDALDNSVTYHQFALGGVLAEYQKRGWSGHMEFYNDIEDRHGFKKRKTQYLISVFKMLTTHDIPWEDAKAVGWTGLRELLPVVDANNYKEWIEKAKGKTAVEIKAMVKAEKHGTPDDPDGLKEPSTPSYTFTFVVHEDQKPLINEAIGKAMTEGETKFEGQALEYMAMDFLAGGKKSSPTINALFQKIKEAADSDSDAVDVIMGGFCSVFPEAQVDVELTPRTITSGEPISD